jgi:hypothetical protein
MNGTATSYDVTPVPPAYGDGSRWARKLSSSTGLPVMCRGLVVCPSPLGLLIEGGPRRQLVSGASADLLARLVALLDGTHCAPDICAELGLDEALLWQALEFLDDGELLDDIAAGTLCSDRVPAHVRDYLSRTAGRTGAPELGYSAADLLAGAAVAVVGEAASQPLVLAVTACLAECGVGTIVGCDPDELAARMPERNAATSRLLVGVCDEPGHADRLDDVVSLCAQRGVPVLRFARTAQHVEIGPAFLDRYTACPACFRRGYPGTFDEGAGQQPDNPHGTPAPCAAGTDELAAGLAAQEMLAIVANLSRPTSARSMLRIAIPSCAAECFDVIPEPDCPSCCRPETTTGPTDADCIDEWKAGAVPAELALTGYALAGAISLADLRATLHEPTSMPRVPLPSPRNGTASQDARLAAELIGSVHQGRADRRAGPEGEKRDGSDAPPIEVCFMIDSGLPGIPGTIFRYDGSAGDAVSVRADVVSITEFLASTDLDPGLADLVVILVAQVARLRSRHGDRAPRVTQIEAGRIAMSLANLAAGHGLSASVATNWGDQLPGYLELNPAAEAIAAVLSFSSSGEMRGRARDHPADQAAHRATAAAGSVPSMISDGHDAVREVGRS